MHSNGIHTKRRSFKILAIWYRVCSRLGMGGYQVEIDMRTVLLVDDEQVVLNSIKDGIETYLDDIKVLVALDGYQALQILHSSKVNLVVTDLNMPVMDGLEFLAAMSRSYPNIPFIVMTGYGTPDVEEEINRLGGLCFVKKPINLKNLADNVAESLESSSSGYIHGVSLATFLQMAAYEQKTATLEIRSPGKVGHLHLQNGKLVDAETDDSKGKDAALQIMNWKEPQIYISNICKRTKRDKYMESSVFSLVLDAARQRDEETQAALSSPHREQLDKAVKFAEALDFREASKVLVALLKEDPNNHEGWLWYSRILGSAKSVEKALKNARRSSPDDPEVIEETKKLDTVREHLVKDQFRRCPFCWTPVVETSFQCHYCNARLSIGKSLVTSPPSARQSILQEAAQRYSAVIQRESNLIAHYYLAMAYLNLRQWKEALSQLHIATNLAPGNKHLANQLQILLDYLASSEAESTQERTEPVSKSIPTVAGFDGARPKRILVVEDSPTTRRVVSVTLSHHGYEVIEARDGLEALSKVNERKPDLVLLDILLPKMDGYKILSIMKDSEQLKSVPVIMLTSKDGFLDKVKGKLAGSTAYLTKPFSPKKLIETVERHLQ